MNRLVIIGALLILLSIGVVYVSSLQFQQGFNNTIIALSIGSNSIAHSNFTLSNSTAYGFVYYANTVAIDYFLLNQSAYVDISQYLNSSSSLPAAVNSLGGYGIIYAAYNSPMGVFPQQSSMSPQYANQSMILLPGTYHVILDNPTSSNAVIYYSTITRQQESISNTLFSSAAYPFVGVILFIAGIVAFIYSLFSGRKAEAPLMSEGEISRLYDSYGRKGGRRVHKPRKK
ncbi:MAG: hypothetical protein M1569_03870 [Candidatus Marsarchaeota archaeon]|nr:hypothetical protein [Candidatus Marsarchaeota archaeon]